MDEALQTMNIALVNITVRADRVTPLNGDATRLLKQSVTETGHIRDAIHVRKVKGGYELIDGRHRLEVAESLKMPTIVAQVWNCTLEEARLMEADANVTFTHMGAVDLAVSLAGRKAAWVKLHPETAQHGFKGNQHVSRSATEMSFTTFMAEILGVTRRQIERVIAAGEALDDLAVINLRDAPKRVVMDDLYHIAKAQGVEERDYIVKSLVSGEAKNAAAARRAYAANKNGAKSIVKDPIDAPHIALLNAWKRAPKDARRRFVRDVGAELGPLWQERVDWVEGNDA